MSLRGGTTWQPRRVQIYKRHARNDILEKCTYSCLPSSVEQLRAKSGKTMVALCVVAGHRKFLQRKGQCAHYGRKLFQPRFCLICRVMALCGKEAFRLISLFGPFVAKTKGLSLRGYERLRATFRVTIFVLYTRGLLSQSKFGTGCTLQ